MRTGHAVQLVLAETTANQVTDVVKLVVAVVVGVIVAVALAEVTSAVVRAAGKRSWLATTLAQRVRRPLRSLLLVVALWIALQIATTPGPTPPTWLTVAEHLLEIALIVTGAWLVGALAFVAEDAALKRYRIDVADNRHARRVRTQIAVLRRITVAVLIVCAVAGVLLTFPGARAAGASVLASAGVISVVAGLAAQSVLGNFFAGIQIAFSDAIRIGDVVVIDGEWGRVEEITMTYVVVHLWDDRRLILPSTRFTSASFANWTRRSSELLGTVELDLDWNVPVAAVRAELRRLLSTTDLWDGRVGVLQVTDAINGNVRLRALASAPDAPTLFDLRCYLREGLVTWLQTEGRSALPRTRWEGENEIPGVTVRVGTSPAGTSEEPPATATVAAGPQAAEGDSATRAADVPVAGAGFAGDHVAEAGAAGAARAADVSDVTASDVTVPDADVLDPDVPAKDVPAADVPAAQAVAPAAVPDPLHAAVPPAGGTGENPAVGTASGATPVAAGASAEEPLLSAHLPAVAAETAPSVPERMSVWGPLVHAAPVPAGSGETQVIVTVTGDGPHADAPTTQVSVAPEVTVMTPSEAGAPSSDGSSAVVSRRSVRRVNGGDAAQGESSQRDTVRLDLSASDSRLFTGSIDAIERSKAFSGPGDEAYAEREEAVEKGKAPPSGSHATHHRGE